MTSLWKPSIENLSILGNSAITWPYTDHLTFRPSAPQVYQCLISHFLASWEPATWYCTSMFWLIDSSQNSVTADQYRLTLSRAQVSTHRVQVFFEVICWQVATFQMIIGSSSIFLKCIWNKSCLWVVCYTAVFSVVTQRSSLRDDTKNGCVAD